MTKVHEKAPIGLRQAENPLVKYLTFPICWSVICFCIILMHRFDPVGLLMRVPIISHLFVAFLWFSVCAMVLVLLLVGVGTVRALYSIVADIFRSKR